MSIRIILRCEDEAVAVRNEDQVRTRTELQAVRAGTFLVAASFVQAMIQEKI